MTVRNCVYGIRSKLGVGSMQELALWAVRHGLLDDYAAGGWGYGSSLRRQDWRPGAPAGTFTGGFVGLRMATAEGQGEIGAQWTGDRASATTLTFSWPSTRTCTSDHKPPGGQQPRLLPQLRPAGRPQPGLRQPR